MKQTYCDSVTGSGMEYPANLINEGQRRGRELNEAAGSPEGSRERRRWPVSRSGPPLTNIVQEEKDEVGRYHGFPDYSELRDQWYSRKPITAPLPWPWDKMLLLCKRFEVEDKETKKRPIGRKLTIIRIILTVVLGSTGIVATVLVDKF